MQPDADQLLSKVAGVPYSYYASVMKDLSDSGCITGVSVTDCINGTSGVLLDNVRLTLAGADFLAELFHEEGGQGGRVRIRGGALGARGLPHAAVASQKT